MCTGNHCPVSLSAYSVYILMTFPDAFMKAETDEFEIGKRHLANIMSLDIDTMTQDDIDVCSTLWMSNNNTI